MNILIISGGPRKVGNTELLAEALQERGRRPGLIWVYMEKIQ